MFDSLSNKHKFVLAIFEHRDVFEAAKSVYKDEQIALDLSRSWQDDDEILSKYNSEIENPSTFWGVMFKADSIGFEMLTDIEKSVYVKQSLVFQINNPANTGKNAISALKLLAEIEDMLSKSSSNPVVNNTQVNYRVMTYKDHGSNNEWEKALLEQQDRLTDDASPIHKR